MSLPSTFRCTQPGCRMCADAKLDSRPRGAVQTVAISSSDMSTRKTHPLESNTESLAVIQPKLYGFKIFTCPTPCTEGTADLSCGWREPNMFGIDRILPGAKFSLRPSPAFSYIGSVTVRHYSSGRQLNFAAWYNEWNYGTFADSAAYIRMGGHHVKHRPTFWFILF